jgi:hypothetical protein
MHFMSMLTCAYQGVGEWTFEGLVLWVHNCLQFGCNAMMSANIFYNYLPFNTACKFRMDIVGVQLSAGSPASQLSALVSRHLSPGIKGCLQPTPG